MKLTARPDTLYMTSQLEHLTLELVRNAGGGGAMLVLRQVDKLKS
jgi:hypothetical protein